MEPKPMEPKPMEPMITSGGAEPALEAGPEWPPPSVPLGAAPPPRAPEAHRPDPKAGAAAALSPAPRLALAAPAAEEAQLADPRVTVAYGARETLDAIRRLEAQVDGLTDWLGAFTAWYEREHRHGSDARARRQLLLVAAMLAVFLPVIVAVALVARFGWL